MENSERDKLDIMGQEIQEKLDILSRQHYSGNCKSTCLICREDGLLRMHLQWAATQDKLRSRNA